MGGSAYLTRITRNGAQTDEVLLHRAGRYNLSYLWSPRPAGFRNSTFAEGVCSSPELFRQVQLLVQELAQDRRFLEPVRLSLSSKQFSPIRRLLWGRERLMRHGSETVTPLMHTAAPFTAYDLTRMHLERLSAANAGECDPGRRLEQCLNSGTECTSPDLGPARDASWAALATTRR